MNDDLKRKEKSNVKGVRGPYMIFSQEQRPILVEQHPNWSMPEISKKISVLWYKMSSEEKSQYVQKSEEDKLRYQKEMNELLN